MKSLRNYWNNNILPVELALNLNALSGMTKVVCVDLLQNGAQSKKSIQTTEVKLLHANQNIKVCSFKYFKQCTFYGITLPFLFVISLLCRYRFNAQSYTLRMMGRGSIY